MKMKTYVFLLVIVLLTCVPAALAEVVDCGQVGNDIYYTLDDEGLLTITGAGSIPSYSFNGNESIRKVVISGNITAVDFSAFEDCINLEYLKIEAVLREIQGYSFHGCFALKEVEFSGTMAQWLAILMEYENAPLYNATIRCTDGTIVRDLSWSINGEGVLSFTGTGHVVKGFAGNTEITRVVLSPGVLSIPTGCFRDCKSLMAFEVEEGSTKFSAVDGVLFSADKTELLAYPTGKKGNYTVPNGVETIADYAFAGSAYLEEVMIPQEVTETGIASFAGCDVLRNIFVEKDNLRGYPYY